VKGATTPTDTISIFPLNSEIHSRAWDKRASKTTEESCLATVHSALTAERV
jgi:hypothetical protein